MSQFERTALLLGEEAIKALSRKKVAIFGLGGVGSWCCEALGRAGVGQLALIDHDTVSESNLNRQLVALHSTIGQPKAAVMAARLRDINPDIKVTEYPLFYMPENADQIDLSGFDCIVDAIDTVTAKLHLIQTAKALGVPIISSMGTGNKLRPDLLTACDISKTTTCPLARLILPGIINAPYSSKSISRISFMWPLPMRAASKRIFRFSASCSVRWLTDGTESSSATGV